MRMNPFGVVGALALMTVSSVALAAEPLDWPTYGPDTGFFRVDDGIDRGDGLTNGIPDIVGAVDGSAKLTIFTEGNHYPVLLPLVLEGFPAFCEQTGRCDVEMGDITIATLPQYMVMAGLNQGGFRFGNATLPVNPDAPVYPDVVMLGAGPIGRLSEAGVLDGAPRVFAKHRGMGLLVDRDVAEEIADLESFLDSDLSFVVATTRERGARRQYLATLGELVGEEATDALFQREVPDFAGRLAIQHRDIPYAVMNEIAPVGLVFGHLADFYADHWPQDMRFVEIPEAAPFGSEISVARTARPAADPAVVDAFLDFLFENAPTAYADGGFASADSFGFGRELGTAQ